ncbi:YbaB/EbfC family nucleoid-associated protein [Cryptosporangium japonicum]|uniref:YbaB/EbfC DNA-binding family protein n=1 Tax=Cryptosporangium japonicum TaxID=80872 RepID=A0ABN0V900_9ACTN
MVEIPRGDQTDWSAISSMAKDLQAAVRNAERTQREALALTGTAWSPDGLIKAVVGPRGHLLELDVDARVYRNPNSKALSAAIVATVRAATDDVMSQSAEILERTLPADLRERAPGKWNAWKLGRMHDADVRETLKREEADGLG